MPKVDWTKGQPEGIRSWLKSRIDGVANVHPETADWMFSIWEELPKRNRLGNQTAIDVMQIVMRHMRQQINTELEWLEKEIQKERRNTGKGDKAPRLDELVETAAAVRLALKETREALQAITAAFDAYYQVSKFGQKNENFRARMLGKL